MFRWQGCAGAFLGPPSEEGRTLLPIPRPLVHEWVVAGGVAEFFNSPWSSWWLKSYTRSTFRHFAMIFQDSVFHAFASSVTVVRLRLTRSDLGALLRDPGLLEQLTPFRNRPSPDSARGTRHRSPEAVRVGPSRSLSGSYGLRNTATYSAPVGDRWRRSSDTGQRTMPTKPSLFPVPISARSSGGVLYCPSDLASEPPAVGLANERSQELLVTGRSP